MKSANRIVSVFLCLVMMTGIFAVSSHGISLTAKMKNPEQAEQAAETETPEESGQPQKKSGMFNFSVYEGEAAITGLTSEAGEDIVIPAELGGFPVIAIENYVFTYNSDIKSVVIPSNIVWLEGNAFEDCVNLESVIFEKDSKVTALDSYAFAGCENLKTVVLPENLEYIGEGAFAACYKLESINLPDSVEYMGCSAFYNTGMDTNESLLEDGALYMGKWLVSVIPEKEGRLEIKEGTEDAVWDAVWGCDRITEISIPASYKGENFLDLGSCEALEKITVDGKNTAYCSEDGVLFNKDKTVLVRYPINRDGNKYEIPSGVIETCDGAFDYCANLKTVVIPSSAQYINLLYCDSVRRIEYDGICEDFEYICDYNNYDYRLIITYCRQSSFIENIFYPVKTFFEDLIYQLLWMIIDPLIKPAPPVHFNELF